MQALKRTALLFDYIGVETIVTIIENSDVYSVDDVVAIITHFIKQTYQVKDVALRCKRMRIIASMLDLCTKSRNIEKVLSKALALADRLGDSDASRLLSLAMGISEDEQSDVGTAITDAGIDMLRYYDMVKPQEVSLLLAALYISMRENDERMIVALLEDICDGDGGCAPPSNPRTIDTDYQSPIMRIVNEEINRRLLYLLYAHLNETKECRLLR